MKLPVQDNKILDGELYLLYNLLIRIEIIQYKAYIDAWSITP
ncbi:protein of unknown function [Candidatus Nitrosocosmicus franklandus]|uniref:Uncharacterized protein n=1 Tax=Candidatus Nitrosocosmicus franklandianus TaxID=1798806 RepID=A0A484I825_9ARCH|nr:protein of unknown function [Candidatus Nitrosocosmicus franklandus]